MERCELWRGVSNCVLCVSIHVYCACLSQRVHMFLCAFEYDSVTVLIQHQLTLHYNARDSCWPSWNTLNISCFCMFALCPGGVSFTSMVCHLVTVETFPFASSHYVVVDCGNRRIQQSSGTFCSLSSTVPSPTVIVILLPNTPPAREAITGCLVLYSIQISSPTSCSETSPWTLHIALCADVGYAYDVAIVLLSCYVTLLLLMYVCMYVRMYVGVFCNYVTDHMCIRPTTTNHALLHSTSSQASPWLMAFRMSLRM